MPFTNQVDKVIKLDKMILNLTRHSKTISQRDLEANNFSNILYENQSTVWIAWDNSAEDLNYLIEIQGNL